MEENKQKEGDEVVLKTDALTEKLETAPHEPQSNADAVVGDPPDTDQIESSSTNTEPTDKEPLKPRKSKNKQRTTGAKALKTKDPRALKDRIGPIVPISEPALPLLVCAVVFVISLIALIIDRFVYSFSGELLAPVILQLVAMVVPTYLSMMITSPNKSTVDQFKELGFRKIHAEHVFFIIFASFFTVCGSLFLTLITGGAGDAAGGITILGTFTAGANEYTVSYPYLILTYVFIPAIAEELLFRGLIFSQIEKVSFPLAAAVSCIACALYGFSLGGLIPSIFVGLMSVFMLYTTSSIISCIILHLVVNLHRLFLEPNVSAYFLASHNTFLLLTTIIIALLISAILFFSEGAKIFGAKANRVSEKKTKSAKKLGGIKNTLKELLSVITFKPSLIFTSVCVVIFAAIVVINHLI